MSSLADAYHDEHGRPLQATAAPQATHRVAQHPKTTTRGGTPYQPPRPITPRPAAPSPVAEEAEKSERRREAHGRRPQRSAHAATPRRWTRPSTTRSTG